VTYSLKFNRPAFKSLEKITDPYYSAIKEAIQGLTVNPRPHGYKKLKGRKGYRIRVGGYRVIYEIFDSLLLIEVIEVGNRRDIYQ